MIYQIAQLADIIDGDRGKNYPKQNEFSDQGFCLFLNAGNVTPTGFSFEENSFITQEKDSSLRKGKLQRGDIVYTTRGTVGNAAFYSETVPFENIRINSGMVILRCHEDVIDKRYLYQILKSEYFRPYFKQYCTGSAQPQLPIMNFSKIELNIPKMEIQRRIADILSAYDDLIENNRKQIKLLEEAAQRLYKEWFVDLRFPGHEHTKITDGVPEGWRDIRLSDVAAINANNIPKNYPFDHIEYTDLSSVQNGIIKETTRYSLADAPGRAKRLATDGDVIWGMVRPNLKSFALVQHPKETDVFSTGFCVLSSKTVPFSYLYYAVTTENFINYLVNCTNGAAYPAVKPIHFAEAKLLCPDTQLLNKFDAIVEPMLRKREKALIMINQAQQARDRLLPKLINGKLENIL